MSIPFVLTFIKSQTQPDGGEGYSGMATGYPVTVPGEEAALPRQGTAKVRGDEQKSSEARICGTSLTKIPLCGATQGKVLYPS